MSMINCFFPSWCSPCRPKEVDAENAANFYLPDSLAQKKLSEVFIAFSHNTFIDGKLQILTFSSVTEVARVILEGVRGIELDVWDKGSDNDTPVVSHGAEWNDLQFKVSTPVNFEDFVKAIAKYGWINSDLPLFLCLELNAKLEGTKNKIATILERYLKNRFFVSTNYSSLGQVTLEELKGKVVIISGGGHNQNLRRLINYVYDQNFRNIGFSSISENPDLKKFNESRFTRIYPNNILFGTNPDPRIAWAEGCTAVAMNYNYNDANLEVSRRAFTLFPIVEKTILQK